jgi:hypothetical protein
MTQLDLTQKWPPPTEQEAVAIAALADGGQRNLQITQGYHDLAIALASVLGAENVSWCAYATWASKTAGVFIRQENVDALIRRYLDDAEYIQDELRGLRRALRWIGRESVLSQLLLIQVLHTATDQVSAYVAAGNVKVYAELAPLYRRFLDRLGHTPTYDEQALAEFQATLAPGSTADGGQDLLRTAFSRYYQARFEPDPKAKAELMLLANVLAGFHEQTRLQDAIAGSMNAPLDEEVEQVMLARVGAVLATAAPALVGQVLGWLWRNRLRRLAVRMADDWRRITTQALMNLELPNETLYLGRDVPPTPAGAFPPALATAENPELAALLAQVDRTPDRLAGSAARDWSSLADRMNFIADFFRSRQQEMALYAQPFTDEQVAAIRRGGRPNGRL